MQGALYYPYIRVPNNVWWTRTLLYWDSVATITPADYISNPDLHDPFTLKLIRNDLLYQLLPREAGDHFIRNFKRFVASHGPQELQRRQTNFQMGAVGRVHLDKFVNRSSLDWLQGRGLAQIVDTRWAMMEEATAAEFMSALALSICEASDRGEWRRREESGWERWVPVTDDPPSTRALLSGLTPVTGSGRSAHGETRVDLRVRGEHRRAEIYSVVLPRILPVPEWPVKVKDIVRFRDKHGDLLPSFRREMEDRFERLAKLDDPIQRQLEMDHLEDEVHERVEQVSAYLSEARLGRVVNSALVSLLKLLPGAKEVIDAASDLHSNSQRFAAFECDPLAYLAFANATFAPVQKYGIDPYTGRPLVSAVSGF